MIHHRARDRRSRWTLTKLVRESAKVSQAVFATILNISVYTVQKWESGDKKPTGAALKLLHMVKIKA